MWMQNFIRFDQCIDFGTINSPNLNSGYSFSNSKKERMGPNQLYYFVPKTMVEYYDWMVLVCYCGTFINNNEKTKNSILYFHFI